MPKKNFKCTVAYDGSSFCGWQKQKNGNTIQGTLEYAAEKYFGYPVKIYGASRTDAGVHALGQVFNFTVDTKLEPKNIRSILNDLLPEEIRIKKVCLEKPGFSSRHNVSEKFYRYILCDSMKYYPFLRDKCWYTGRKIDAEAIKGILGLFKGEKNYYSFSTSGSSPKSYMREIRAIKIKREGKFVYIDFFGRGFLYNMIRKITAVLMMYSWKEMSREEIEELFTSEDRALVKHSAPPGGLYLVKITYLNPKSGNADAMPEKQEAADDA